MPNDNLRRSFDRQYRILIRYVRLSCFILALSCLFTQDLCGQKREAIDPSGGWRSMHGVLSLMLAGDVLSFSYSSVFGSTAHLCDGAGVAARVRSNVYYHLDEQGTVAFIISDDGVRMTAIDGIASFCGANWPGEDFTREGYEPPMPCILASPKSFFHAVTSSAPEKTTSYVINGNRVETLPVRHERGEGFTLARFKGRTITTVGLLQTSTLECP